MATDGNTTHPYGGTSPKYPGQLRRALTRLSTITDRRRLFGALRHPHHPGGSSATTFRAESVTTGANTTESVVAGVSPSPPGSQDPSILSAGRELVSGPKTLLVGGKQVKLALSPSLRRAGVGVKRIEVEFEDGERVCWRKGEEEEERKKASAETLVGKMVFVCCCHFCRKNGVTTTLPHQGSTTRLLQEEEEDDDDDDDDDEE